MMLTESQKCCFLFLTLLYTYNMSITNQTIPTWVREYSRRKGKYRDTGL